MGDHSDKGKPATHAGEGWPDWEINSLRDRVAELQEEVEQLRRENRDLKWGQWYQGLNE